MTAGYFDDDADLDLAVALGGDSWGYSILFGNGNGTLAAPHILPVIPQFLPNEMASGSKPKCW